MKDLYPNYDVTKRAKHWDANTRAVVNRRIHEVPLIRFFDDEEAALLRIVIDRLIPPGPKGIVPVLNYLDEELVMGLERGFRYSWFPPRGEFWRVFLRTLDTVAKKRFVVPFSGLNEDEQDEVLWRLSEGDGLPYEWSKLSPDLAFREVLTQLAGIYCSHPYAWSEMGWGGPIYPESYFTIGCGLTEPWEPKPEEEKGGKYKS